MRNDRQRGWLWMLGFGVGALVIVAGTWRSASVGQIWRAIVKVKVDYPSLNQVVPYNPNSLGDVLNSASNTLTDAGLLNRLVAESPHPQTTFRFLGAKQYRSTWIIELKFSGATALEVQTLSEAAARVWCERLSTNHPPIPAELIETEVLPTSHDRRNLFRQWRWEHFGF